MGVSLLDAVKIEQSQMPIYRVMIHAIRYLPLKGVNQGVFKGVNQVFTPLNQVFTLGK